MKRCSTPYCRNFTRHGNICYTCSKRRYRNKYPLRAAFMDLRTNAKRRNKEFTLTLSQFELFCIKTKYLQGKGKTKDSFSIDRKDDSKGYTLSNIRILTLGENSRKEIARRKVLEYDYRTRFATVRDLSRKEAINCPF